MTLKSLQTAPRQRLNPLNALHGFDMYWITGGGASAIAI
ncbi:MAG: hypothetical protein FD181_697 [Prolixibacteraceae bacterium]|mgnify:CR=1 FL=1|nr:MAG: hypothetical protein FD181_697 [Prolixibacteraceae bacterium]